jgi:acetyl/propionyl-CoA carboxylase alpha subunit
MATQYIPDWQFGFIKDCGTSDYGAALTMTIQELAHSLSSETDPFGYADDVALWYEIDDDFDPMITTAVVNGDMQALLKWGNDNKTTFEPEKMSVMVVSQKHNPFDASGIFFNNEELSIVDETTLVGLKIDRRMRWGPMVDKLATKARQRIGALSKVRQHLNSDNLKTVYQMFIRSIMEYNSVSWMGAAQSYLDKLDRVQLSAQKIGNFSVESLQARREAAAMSLALKLLDGKGRGDLQNFVPALIEPIKMCKRITRHTLDGIQLASNIKATSLDVYKRSFQGVLPQIWEKIPSNIIARGKLKGWLKIKTACTNFLTGKSTPNTHTKQKDRKGHQEIHSTELNNELNGIVQFQK